jgi:hypothetical protein
MSTIPFEQTFNVFYKTYTENQINANPELIYLSEQLQRRKTLFNNKCFILPRGKFAETLAKHLPISLSKKN